MNKVATGKGLTKTIFVQAQPRYLLGLILSMVPVHWAESELQPAHQSRSKPALGSEGPVIGPLGIQMLRLSPFRYKEGNEAPSQLTAL